MKIAGSNNNQAQEIYEVVTASFSGSMAGTYNSNIVTLIQASRERLNLGNNEFPSGAHSPDTDAVAFQDFSGGSGFVKPIPTKDQYGVHRNPHTTPGAPKKHNPYGIHGISARPSDGLFTSGSWTYEAFYSFPPRTGTLSYTVTQSLSRICASGTATLQLLGTRKSFVVASRCKRAGVVGCLRISECGSVSSRHAK